MKRFLEQNKIYFEIFTSLLFSMAALFVSLASYRVSSQQLAINAQNSQPHFSVQTSYIYDDATGKYDDTQLIVTNITGFAYNIHCQVYSFIQLGLFVGKQRKDALVPLSGYYPVSHRSGASVGTLYIFTGPDNNAHYLLLNDSLKKQPMPADTTLAESKLQNLVVIDYLDITKETRKAYFLDGEAIEDDKAQQYLNTYNGVKPLELDKVGAMDVLNAAVKSIQKVPAP